MSVWGFRGGLVALNIWRGENDLVVHIQSAILAVAGSVKQVQTVLWYKIRIARHLLHITISDNQHEIIL